VVGAIAVAATVLPGGGGTSSTVPDVVDSPSTTTPADVRRPLADKAVIEERLLESLPDGEVADLTVKSHPGDDGAPAGVQVRLLLEGGEVTLAINDTSRERADFSDPGPRPEGCDESVVGGEELISGDELEAALDALAQATTPEASRACLEWAEGKRRFECAQDAVCWKEMQIPPPCADAACIELPDGSWLRSGTEATYEDDPNRPTAWPRAWATRATADQWWLSVDAGGPAKWAAPILDEEQVAALARSDAWFE
jgi:hypothetical protein